MYLELPEIDNKELIHVQYELTASADDDEMADEFKEIYISTKTVLLEPLNNHSAEGKAVLINGTLSKEQCTLLPLKLAWFNGNYKEFKNFYTLFYNTCITT